MAPVVYWGIMLLQGMQPPIVIWILVLGIGIVSMYTVFGEKRTDKALDKAKGMTGQGDDEE